MKKPAFVLLGALALASAPALAKDTKTKSAPVEMTDAEMNEVVAGEATPNSPTPSGIAPGGGLGIPQAMGNQVPPGVLNGTAQPPSWSAIGAPSTPGVSGSIIGGGSTGPTGVTAAGSPNNPGLNQPSIPHGPGGV